MPGGGSTSSCSSVHSGKSSGTSGSSVLSNPESSGVTLSSSGVTSCNSKTGGKNCASVSMTSAEPARTTAYSPDICWRVVWQRMGMELSFKAIGTAVCKSVVSWKIEMLKLTNQI